MLSINKTAVCDLLFYSLAAQNIPLCNYLELNLLEVNIIHPPSQYCSLSFSNILLNWCLLWFQKNKLCKAKCIKNFTVTV